MADNVQLPVTGTGTADVVAATDDVAGVHYPFVKLADGTLGGTDKIGGDATNGLDVDVTRSALPTGASTLAEQQTQTTALQLLDDPVKADDAAFTVGTDKVMMAGAKATAFGSAPDAADDADAVALLTNRHRILFVLGGHPNVKSATYNRTDAGTDDNLMAAISAGTKYAVTRISVTLDEACTVGVAVRIGFGTASVPALGASAADAVDDILLYHPGMVPGSIMTVGDGSGILGVGGDGAELRLSNEVPTGGTLGVTVTYFPIES